MPSLILFGCIAAGFLLLAAAFTTVEAAILQVSAARLSEMEETRSVRALTSVLENRATYVNPLILLRTICEAAAAALICYVCFQLLEDSTALVVAVIAISLSTFVVVGVMSRTLGRKNPYKVALSATMVLRPLTVALGPFATGLIRLGNLFTPSNTFDAGPFAGELELREMVDLASQRGVVQIEERRMIQGVFDLAQTRARAVMVPRTDMLWIEHDKSLRQAINLFVKSGHSRIPVVGETVDDVRGVLYLKDVVGFIQTNGSESGDREVQTLMRRAEFVPDSISLDKLLHDMQTSHDHIALVVDEFGGIAGLVSIEDILEEIVGEISDEYDQDEEQPVTELEDGTFRVVSRLTLDELAELLEEKRGIDLEFTDEQLDEVDTVGGLAAFELGRVPLPGAVVETNGLRLTCEGGRDRRGRLRISAVVVQPLVPAENDV